jgi:nucleotide-binding universal stress UspA family protein
MRKILIAIDGSKCASKAVDYAGKMFSGMDDVKITLLHVLPYLATSLWDDGHILTKQEREARKKVADLWKKNQQARIEPIFAAATGMLVRRGIQPARIETKTISDSADTADSILEETRDGGYQTLVVGRCGLTAAKRVFMGSVTNKIISRGAGTAICVVE